MDLAADLADHLADQYDLPEDDEGRARFVWDSESKANWGLRELGKLRARQGEIQRLAAEQRALIDEWAERQTGALDHDVRHFEGALADYWRRELDAQLEPLIAQGLTFDEAWAKLKRKSRELPGGILRATKGRASVVLEDPTSFVNWARDNGHLQLLSYPEPQPSKAAIAGAPQVDGHVVLDGEKAPGVRIDTPGVTYQAVPSTR